MTRYRISHAARSDIINILAWTQDQLGKQARQRYERPIAAAIRDNASAPTRLGSRERPELGDGVRSWHLRGGGKRSTGDAVRRPRHFIVYRIDNDTVVIGRILHDAMELRRHVDTDTSWE